MAFSSGHNGAVTVNGTSLVPYVTSVTPSTENKTLEVNTLGDGWVDRISGVSDLTFKVEGIFDPAVDAIVPALIGSTAVPYFIYPQGNASGKRVISGTGIVSNYEAPFSADEAVTFSFEIQNASGGTAPTFGTVA